MPTNVVFEVIYYGYAQMKHWYVLQNNFPGWLYQYKIWAVPDGSAPTVHGVSVLFSDSSRWELSSL